VNHTSVAVASAVAFAWLGMVVALSFIEAPSKFHAPGVTTVVVVLPRVEDRRGGPGGRVGRGGEGGAPPPRRC
jgi:hypothetical protein